MNYRDASCALCTERVPRAHMHRDGHWYVPSNSLPDVVYKVRWIEAWCGWVCSCTHYSFHGRCGPYSNHIMLIQPFVRLGLTCAPRPRIVESSGGELFEEDRDREQVAA